MTNFAYWICAIEEDSLSSPLEDLASAMSTQCDLEEQIHDCEALNHIQRCSPKPLTPLAPVSFCDCWSPFPELCKLLEDPLQAEFSSNDHRTLAFAIWRPRWLGDTEAVGETRDIAHLRYLTRLASSKAKQMHCNVFVMGKIGWIYPGEFNGMNPEAALAMLKYGFVYPDRVAR